ncbi:heparinase II/III family protein [Tabrizicola sp. YIM 78059]|uniref:heparinase II/III family protein n=1 Tax=Tabrizicola sp. YIM 78059 TaxID=2529861 RepID=UPI0020BEFC36|nr:heparinase II/III family protein [Tabrizicola sp. YIM 78059]
MLSARTRANRAHQATGQGMGGTGAASERMVSLADRLAILAARRARVASGFVMQPEPRSIGVYAHGKRLTAGHILLAGHLAEAPGTPLWDLAPDPAFVAAAQGFSWLDDLAAFGTPTARRRAQDWTWDWIARFGTGKGPGWSPELTGRRIIRWIHHATFLLTARNRAQTDAFHRALSLQAAFLSRRWKGAPPGLPRFEALAGLIHAGLLLIGMERLIAPATAALAGACDADIDGAGGIPSRNPEELMDILTLLTWSATTMTETGHPVPDALSRAITRTAPTLRALRHADGTLARFHGGDRGIEGRLDQALAAAGARLAAPPAIAMGFARLSGRRTSVIVDASAPPAGRAALTAHASTAAFELTSGRRPLVVSCGAGDEFGPAWRLAARATQSHSVLCLEGVSSSRLSAAGDALQYRAAVTESRLIQGHEGSDLYIAHDGWLSSHGLTAGRSLTLSHDGRRLSGVETLTALTAEARRRFEEVMSQTRMDGTGFAVRFHLHPEVEATLDTAGTAVSMLLRSGEIWLFRATGPVVLSLEPSAYLEKGRLDPRPCRQIVLRGQVRTFETRIGWTLAKAQDTPLAIRDLEGAEAGDPLGLGG